MAKMIPNLTEKDDIYKFNKSHAERKLYFLLKDKTPDNWTVHYSVVMPKGEADFLICHPEYGLLIIEVKGGQEIHYENNCWWSISAKNEEFAIHDPITQTNICKRTLRDFFEEKMGVQKVPIYASICFPDVDKIIGAPIAFHGITTFLRPDITFNIEKSIVQAFLKDPNRRVTEKYNPSVASDVNKLLTGANMKISKPLKNKIEDNEELIHILSTNQMELFQVLEEHKKIIVNGVAGSGKTILALKIAQQKAEEGKRVLLTCKNRMLGDELRKMTKPGTDLVIGNFDKFIYDELIKLPDFKNRLKDINNYPDLLLEASDHIKPFDVIIMDEAQDFNQNAKEALEFIHREGDKGEWYIFRDEDQDLTSYSRIPINWDKDFVKLSLKKNMRNPEDINNIAEFLKTGDGDPYISDVLKIATAKKEHFHTKISNIVGNLINTERVNPDQIVILHDGKEEKLLENRYSVLTTSIRKFKGLERPVVILAHIDNLVDYSDARSLMYVGATRATTALYIVGTDETLDIMGIHPQKVAKKAA